MPDMITSPIEVPTEGLGMGGEGTFGFSRTVGAPANSNQLGSSNLRSIISIGARIADPVLIVLTGLLAYELVPHDDDYIQLYRAELLLSALLSAFYFNYAGLYSITN